VLVHLENRVFGGITRGGPAAARARMRRSVPIVASRPDVALQVADTVADGVPVRIYRPAHARAVLVYLHGGGWVQGDRDTHDALCRRLAAADRVVVSADYRLAPEHPFPAAVDDTVTVLRWARANVATLGSDRIEVGGDSAGGNLAAVACIVLRDAGLDLPSLQLLIYPGLDQRRLAASHATFAEGFLLTAADIDWFQGHYAAPVDDVRASPLLADLHGLPPAIVTTAGFDPLRDEGEAYVAKLRAAGVPVTHLEEASLVHGYANMDGALPAADRAVARIVEALRAAS
jgi:acetyl esterase/lipase